MVFRKKTIGINLMGNYITRFVEKWNNIKKVDRAPYEKDQLGLSCSISQEWGRIGDVDNVNIDPISTKNIIQRFIIQSSLQLNTFEKRKKELQTPLPGNHGNKSAVILPLLN